MEIERAIKEIESTIIVFKQSIADGLGEFADNDAKDALEDNQNVAESLELAIKALEEKAEREKGCDFCNTKNQLTKTGLSIISKPYLQVYIAKQPLEDKHFMVISEYEELNNIKGQFSNSPFRNNKVEVKYCPMCGRKLVEE